MQSRSKKYFADILIIAFILNVPFLSHAKAKAEEEIIILPTVVVTATRLENSLKETAASVTVIEGKTLEAKQIKTVLEALRNVPGLDLVQTGGAGGTTSVFLRGTNSSHTLVLIDGVQVNSPTLGQYDFGNLTTDNIERIEIIRGPQSTLYGSEAIGGVIQIFTKKGSGPFSGKVSLEGGSFDSYRESLHFNGEKGRINYSFSASRFDTEGFSKAKNGIEKDGYENTSLSSRVGLQFTKNARLDWTLHFTDAGADVDAAFPIGDNRATQANEMVSSSLSLSSPVHELWDQKLQLSFQKEKLEGKDSDPLGAFNNFKIDTQVHQIDWQHNIQIGQYNEFTAGYEYELQKGKNRGSFKKSLGNNAGYILNQFQAASVVFNAGLRFDDNQQFGDETTYKTELAYFIDATQSKIRAAYGTGFHAPTLNDLYFPGFGNPNLKPEESQSAEVGFEQKLMDEDITLSATYFHTQIDELIVFVSDPITFIGMPENVEKAQIYGWELGTAWAISKQIQVALDYTQTQTKNVNTGTELARRPEHKGNATLSVKPSDRLRLSLDFRYVGTRYNDAGNTVKINDYSLVHLATTFEASETIQLFGRVENLFDREYDEIPGFGTAGLSAYGGLKVQF